MTESNVFRTVAYLAFALIVACYFAFDTSATLTDGPINRSSDAHQNARIAYHLVHTGVWGYDDVETDKPHPQMKREPLPILAIAAVLMVDPDFSGSYTIAQLTSAPLVKRVKVVNVFWVAVACIFMLLLCKEIFPNIIVAGVIGLLALAASNAMFFSRHADNLFTEIPASALMLGSSWCAVRFVRRRTTSRAIGLGVSLGALALTKAAFFYVGVGFVVLLLIMDLRASPSPVRAFFRDARFSYAAIMLAFLATLGPWVLRNAIEFGKPQIAKRGADVLALRVLITEQPLTGSLYAFSPDAYRPFLGPLWGYSPQDLQPGGKLFAILDAKHKRFDIYRKRMEAEGVASHGHADEAWLRKFAFGYIAQHPVRYLASIAVFAYRGMWFLDWAQLAPWMGPLTRAHAAALTLVCFLAIFFDALFRGNRVLIAALGLSIGSLFFYALFSHNIPRYNAPNTPFVILSLLWLIEATARKFIAGWWRSLPTTESPRAPS
jgi:hypothetical protein